MTTSTSALPITNDDPYRALLQNVQRRFIASVANNAPLFTTDIPELYTRFLEALPMSEQQEYQCSACRQFVHRFGGLVVIDAAGIAHSALWHPDDAPAPYQASIAALHQAVTRAKVTGVFSSSLPVWGRPVTGLWEHFAVTPPATLVFKRMTQTASQASAEKREDYTTLCRALAEFTPAMLTQAVALLKSEALYRSEKVLGVAAWLLALHQQRAAAKSTRRDNLTWRAVATAPAGFCHPRASMIGTLLADIAAGLPFADVSARFAAKMHPLQYQRPQAAPTAGNIAQAEKVIAQLQAAGALNRRFARLDDVQALWTPALIPTQDRGGVFGHLLPKGKAPAQQITPPPQTMTWEKFARTVLPIAQQIALLTPAHGSYGALVTAVDPDAPPILQWDRETQRNPVSWYVYVGGSSAANWHVPSDAFHPVTAIARKPSMWYGDIPHQGKGVIFILDGARDMRHASVGAVLFPEFLKSEFHSIRATIEAYSKSATLADAAEASACGLILHSGNSAWDTVVRVMANGIALDYRLDRWD